MHDYLSLLGEDLPSLGRGTAHVRSLWGLKRDSFLQTFFVTIEELLKTETRLKYELCNIPALFWAVDGLVLTHSINEARVGIRKLLSVAQNGGLDIKK